MHFNTATANGTSPLHASFAFIFSRKIYCMMLSAVFFFSSSQFLSNFGHSFVIFKLVISDTLYRFATKMRWINLLIWRCPYIFTIFAFLCKNRNFIIIRLSYSKFHQFHLNRQQLRNSKLILLKHLKILLFHFLYWKKYFWKKKLKHIFFPDY